MGSHLHADDVDPWLARRVAENAQNDPPSFKVRPPWLAFLAKHFAPRNHERYLLQGVELTADEWAALRALPRKRPSWLAFLYRQFHRIFPEPGD